MPLSWSGALEENSHSMFAARAEGVSSGAPAPPNDPALLVERRERIRPLLPALRSIWRSAMPQPGWSQKRERQYEHIKEGLLERGANEDKAEEYAARTVNKKRARAGKAREPGRTWTDDFSSARAAGWRSHSGSKA